MVKLNRIYTRSGDDGSTGLSDGSRVFKDDVRIAAYGSVDELNATIGICIGACGNDDENTRDALRSIQHDLFDLGADLSTPERAQQKEADPRAKDAALRIVKAQVVRVEKLIDAANEELSALNSFVLPGGSALSQRLHLARTVCRRAERHTVSLSRKGRVNPYALQYLNRLSDFLFVASRMANEKGKEDVLWRPGSNRD
jgi:cob(I)alamin adenosyltransferase